MRSKSPLRRLSFGFAFALLTASAAGRAHEGSPGRGGLRAEGASVVWIGAGTFRRGSSEADIEHARSLCAEAYEPLGTPERCDGEAFEEELPARRIHVSAFGIDRTEVTQAAHDRCVRANRCPPTRVSDGDPRVGGAALPATGLRWSEAAHYCAEVGGRLPTEAEWERAARGDGLAGERRFSWGRIWNPRLSNHGRAGGRPDGVDGFRYAAPVGAFPHALSPHGLLDMSGNVWEWTADAFAERYYQWSPAVDPRGPEAGTGRIIRGGSWRSPPHTHRVAYRLAIPEGASAPDLGFRCAYDPR